MARVAEVTEEEIVAEVVESDWENSCDPMKIKNMSNGINAQNLKNWPGYILAHHRVESFCRT